MFFFINIFFIIFFHILVKIFFNFKNINFKKLTLLFLFLYLILILVTYLDFLKIEYNEFNILYLIINLLIFFSYILTIGLKNINSPTYYILETFKKNNLITKNHLIKYLENKNIFQDRFIELQKEKMIILENNKIFLTRNGVFFAKFMKLISVFFGVKSKG